MKIRNILVGALAIMGLVSCEKAVDALVTVDKTEVTFEKEGGSETITFTATAAWTVTGIENQQWLTVDQEAGKGSFDKQTITIQVTPNEGAERSLSLKIQSTVFARKTILIKQAGDGSSSGGDTPTHGEGTGEGTLESPYDIAKVLTILENGQETANEVYFKGIVSNVKEVSTSYGNATYWVSDTGEAKVNDFEVYRGWYLNGTKFTSADQIKVGDVVVVQGVLTNYNGTYETSQGAKLISINGSSEIVVPEAQATTVAAFLAGKDTATAYRLTGTISNFTTGEKYYGFTLTDETGSISCPFPSNWSEYKDVLKDGYKVTVQGAYYLYTNKNDGSTTEQVQNATIISYEAVDTPVETVSYEGVVVAVSKVSFLMTTSEGYAYAFDDSSTSKVGTVNVGDKVKVEGEKVDHNGCPEVKNFTIENLGKSEVTVTPEPTALTGATLDTYSQMFGYVSFTGKITVGNYINVTVTGATKTASLVSTALATSELSGKIVDITGYFVGISGSSSQYVNFIATKITLSDDQTGADEALDPSKEEIPEDVTPGENEVLYALKNAEIINAGSTSTSYAANSTVNSASGKWVGNCVLLNNTTDNKQWLQLRNAAGSYLTSPEFSSKVTRVIIAVKVEKTATSSQARKIYAVPTVDAKALLEAYPAKDNKYDDDAVKDAYANISFNLNALSATPSRFEMSFGEADVKQFSLLAYSGACYIHAIYVFCEK